MRQKWQKNFFCKEKKKQKKNNNNKNVDVNNVVIAKLFETKTNSKYLIGYLDRVLRP